MKALSRTKKMVAGGALVLAGFGASAAVAVTGSASAATDAVSSGVSQAATQLDPTKSVRPDEHLLTGTTAAKVRAAALRSTPTPRSSGSRPTPTACTRRTSSRLAARS